MRGILKMGFMIAAICFITSTVEAAKIYEAKSLITGNILKVDSESIVDQGIKIDYTIKKDMIVMKITNTSDELITVDLNGAKYIGMDKKNSRAYDFKQKERGWFESLTPAGIRPNDYYEAHIVPSSNLKSIPSTGVTGGTIYIGQNLFSPESEEMKNAKRDYAEIIVPIVQGAPYSGISRDIMIYLGDKENIKIENRPAVQPVKTVAPTKSAVLPPMPEVSHETTTKLQQVQEDNTKLKAEIEAREKLLQYLKEQEILKKQLAEKEAEIQKLLKTTTP